MTTGSAAARDSDWQGVRLHVVTGKGGTGKTTVAAALALALADRGQAGAAGRGRGAPGHQPDLRRHAAGPHRGAHLRTPRTAARSSGLAVDAKAALLEYLQMFYKLGRAGSACWRGSAPSTSPRRSPPASATSCSPARSTRPCAAAGTPRRGGRGPTGVRRRGPRRAADRARRALPQRQPRGGGRRQGGPDPQPGRLDHRDAAVAADRRARRHAAGGDARAGDRRRDRRAARGRLPVGGVVVNQVREPLLPAPALAAAAGVRDRTRARSPPTSRPSACGPATRWCGAC